MRRPPKSRHTIAAIIILAISVLAGLHAALQPEPSDRQIRSAAMVAAMNDGEAFATDGLLGNERLKKLDNPLWTWLIGQMRVASGDDYNISSWFAPLSGPLTAIYLIGMYGLLWRQCRSWKAACTAAILSLVVIEPIKNVPWGMGPLHIIGAESIVVAFTPMAAWMLWIAKPRPALLWGFVGIGVLANFDFTAAISLAIVLAITRLTRKLPTRRELIITPLALMAAIAASAPMLSRWTMAADSSNSAWSSIAAAIALNGPALHESSTKMIMALFELSTISRLLSLIIPGAIAAIGFERFRTPNRRLWFTASISCIVLTVIFITLSNVIPAINNLALTFAANTIRLIMLAIYVLFTQAMVNVSRSGMRHAMCWIFVLFSLCWLIPSDNLAWPRHKIEHFAASFMPEESKPRNVLNRQDRLDRQTELKAIGKWLRANTQRGARIICNESELRIYAERPLVAADSDYAVAALINSDDAAMMYKTLSTQREMLSPADGKLDTVKLKAFILENNASAAVTNAWSIAPEDIQPKYWPESPQNGWSDKLRLFVLP